MIFYIFKCNFLAIFYSLKYNLPLAQKDCAGGGVLLQPKTNKQTHTTRV